MSNQRRVWEEEKKALDERKRIDQMMKERQEERQIQELQEMQEAAGGRKRLNRVDWMYSGPSSGQAGTTEEMEGYLLGKRRIDGLVKGTENKKLEKLAAEDSFIALQNANTIKDTASKIREDPMLAIKKQEQAAYEGMMNDPVRRRALLKAAGAEEQVKEKDRQHRKHRHSRHEHDECYERHKSHKRRRLNNDESYSRSSRYHHRRRSGSSSYSRSPSPYRQRSPSPYYRGRRSSPYHRRSRSPERRSSDHHNLKGSKSWSNSVRRRSFSGEKTSQDSAADERTAKLAAMQQAASELDQDRDKRVSAITEREKAERESDEAARAKSARHGGRGDFVHGLNRKAGDLDIGERMRRGRGGLEREKEEY